MGFIPIQTRHLNFGAVNPFPQLFDLDRVEVLRGPQGTQFGAGAEGGVVRFIAPEPNLQRSGAYVRGDVADTKNGAASYEGGFAFGAPIIENKLAFRASVSYRQDGGYVDRVGYNLIPNPANATTPTPAYNGVTTEKNSNTWDTVTARVALKWQPTDDVTVTPSVYYQHLKVADTGAYWVALSDPGSAYRNGNARKNSSDDPFSITALKVTWNLGFADFYSNTSFLARDMSSNSDYTQYLRATWTSFVELPNTFPQSPADGGYALFHDTQRNFYQEFRLSSKDPSSRFVWSTGLFYSHLKENVPEQIVDPTLDAEIFAFSGTHLCTPAPAGQPCPNGVIANTPTYQVVDKQIAAFGEVTYKITDAFKVTGGLRVSKIDYTGSVDSFGPFIGATIVAQASGSEKPVTPKVVASWQPDHDTLVYASASKGFRPGGPNAVVGSICNGSLNPLGLNQVPGQFNSDSLWSYEIGAKNAFLDHKLQIDASIYYIDWSDIQQNVYLASCGEQFTANLGHAKSQGGEIEVQYKPLDALLLDATAAYVDAKLTKTACAGTLTVSNNLCGPSQFLPLGTKGDALLAAPWSLTAAAEYRFPEWRMTKPYARLDFQYTTAQTALVSFQNPNNGVSDPTIPGLPVTRNLSLRAGTRFNGVDLSVYGNNLTNAHPLMYEARDIYSSSIDTLYFGRSVRPLTVGMTATYRY